MSRQAKINPQKHRGAQCLSAAELGAKDGASAKRLGRDESAASAWHHRHVKTGRLTPFDASAYVRAFIAALLLAGCTAQVADEPVGECGWVLAGVGFAGDTWRQADIAESCGYLPVGISPCDMTPERSWTNDGGAIEGWRKPGAECQPTAVLK